MSNASDPGDRRRGNILLGVAILLAAVSLLTSRFSYDLCASGIPMTVPSVAIPGIGAFCAFVALFFASSRASITGVKVALVAVNFYMLAVAGILLTGMGLVNCG
jgi:hypothetical protein